MTQPVEEIVAVMMRIIVAETAITVIAKRRISKILKTGMVQKTKKVEGAEMEDKGDAWSRYMQEVNKYRSNKCIEEDTKTRPLMK
nr:hypothetical protein BaRGS_032311 [Batillaria attramentaria]